MNPNPLSKSPKEGRQLIIWYSRHEGSTMASLVSERRRPPAGLCCRCPDPAPPLKSTCDKILCCHTEDPHASSLFSVSPGRKAN